MLKCWLIPIILPLFCGCAAHNSRWEVSAIQTGDASFDSKRLVYKTQNELRDLELELLYYEGRVHAFLGMHMFSIAGEKESSISFISKKGEYICKGTLLEGGQKILLSEHDTLKLIDLLKESKELFIETGGFKCHVDSSGFKSKYNSLLRASSKLWPNEWIKIAF